MVRRDGGEVALEGGRLLAREDDFPLFQTSDEYVLFLKPGTDSVYVIPHGAQGAFRVRSGGIVEQVSRNTGNWNRERGAMPLQQFLREVAAAAK